MVFESFVDGASAAQQDFGEIAGDQAFASLPKIGVEGCNFEIQDGRQSTQSSLICFCIATKASAWFSKAFLAAALYLSRVVSITTGFISLRNAHLLFLSREGSCQECGVFGPRNLPRAFPLSDRFGGRREIVMHRDLCNCKVVERRNDLGLGKCASDIDLKRIGIASLGQTNAYEKHHSQQSTYNGFHNLEI